MEIKKLTKEKKNKKLTKGSPLFPPLCNTFIILMFIGIGFYLAMVEPVPCFIEETL